MSSPGISSLVAVDVGACTSLCERVIVHHSVAEEPVRCPTNESSAWADRGTAGPGRGVYLTVGWQERPG